MINANNIPLTVRQVSETLSKDGFEAYLVGGCVRDLIIGKIPKYINRDRDNIMVKSVV